jgi:Na+-driven multidrug efflux pump
MLELGVGAGLILGLAIAVLRPWLVLPFTNDTAVRDQTEQILWIVAALQPVAAAVFIFDGILIGAGDARYLAGAMVVASAVYAIALVVLGSTTATLVALWAAFAGWMVLRWLGLFLRFRTDRWAVVGAAAPR